MQDFRKLKVWQRAQDACVRIYVATADYPVEERYGLMGQLRRASVSVGANLAEGAKRSSKADKKRLWELALGSAAEIMSELDVAVWLEYPNNADAVKLAQEYDEISAMLNSLIECLKGDKK